MNNTYNEVFQCRVNCKDHIFNATIYYVQSLHQCSVFNILYKMCLESEKYPNVT